MRLLSLFTYIFTFIAFFGSHTAFAQSAEELYQQKCGRCHTAYAPSDFSGNEWYGLVKSMKAQAALTSDELETITEYLVSESSDESEDATDGGMTWGGYLYTEYFQSPEKRSNFDLHYLAVSVSGWVNEKISYLGEFEFEHGGKGDNTFVEQAYMDYWFLPNSAVKIGAMLTPFNRFDDFHDPLNNHLITRPQVSREIGGSAWKDVGVDVHGYFNIENSSISYNLYAINGLGDGANLRGSRQYRDNNENIALGGRISYLFRNHVEIGGSGYSGAWDDSSDHNLTMIGAHLLVKSSMLSVYGEYANAVSENPMEADGEMSGYFVELSRMFHGKYRTTLRYGGLDYLDEGTLLGRIPTDGNKDVTELALGLNYYPTRNVSFKAEYTIFTEGDRQAEKDNDQIGLQAAVKF